MSAEVIRDNVESEPRDNPRSFRQLGKVAAKGLAYFGAGATVVFGGLKAIEYVDRPPDCGETVDLIDATPRGYMMHGDEKYSINTRLVFGEHIITVGKGIFDNNASSSWLKEDPDGTLKGTVPLGQSGAEMTVVLNNSKNQLQTSCDN